MNRTSTQAGGSILHERGVEGLEDGMTQLSVQTIS